MRTVTKKEIYITASVFFLVSLFLVLFFLYPTFNDITKESQNLVSQENSVILLEKEFDETGNFQKNYMEYQPNLQKIENLFIDSQNPVAFIKFLEKTASDFGLVLEISSPFFTKEGDVSFANFQISVTGGFSGILKFTKALEYGPYLVRIQNLDINNNTGPNHIKEEEASILIKAFVNNSD